ncbi:hypothetical protein A3A93_03990 [Candidatus Roizmanbacteria bacterium RIFCSPLOWO2_01_FULL_38_12]|uniref:Uncharacterized protein n=1 Tax=Candidatus Roizmanbacteria bacterium RIFCSPLOWO2_01_FULL_38_12 TaxID=1802061 RepID=A0A1F7ITS7_9BACT|nr:MAG: hypothetical protein A3A93_03990 [Candidatus Roizmanbacteria bacterium RIFCSPLOWO2_01_FULL_38_12]
MKDESKNDLYDRIQRFQHNVLARRPSVSQMVSEVHMMNFKIRPVYGNITTMDFANKRFIEALWSLGKLDEFFRDEFTQVTENERETFFRLVDEMRVNLQQQLNTAYSTSQSVSSEEKLLYEIEIYKEIDSQVN